MRTEKGQGFAGGDVYGLVTNIDGQRQERSTIMGGSAAMFLGEKL